MDRNLSEGSWVGGLGKMPDFIVGAREGVGCKIGTSLVSSAPQDTNLSLTAHFRFLSYPQRRLCVSVLV
jgi:hypothetical protein